MHSVYKSPNPTLPAHAHFLVVDTNSYNAQSRLRKPWQPSYLLHVDNCMKICEALLCAVQWELKDYKLKRNFVLISKGIVFVTTQVDRLNDEDCWEKAKIQRILKPCLVEESDIFAEVRDCALLTTSALSLNSFRDFRRHKYFENHERG